MALSACGGGGGGGGPGGGGGYIRNSVPYYTPTSGGSYQPLAGSGYNSVIHEIYTQDLNRDNVQEVVIGGRKSQPSTQAQWQDYNMQIYGWNTGSFTKETSSWFTGADNRILGTEPSIRFGDFNGDGHVDMFVAPSTDMTYYGNGLVFLNSGRSSFTRSEIPYTNLWAHDSVVNDFNGDGFADIMALDYNGRPVVSFGSANGTFTNFRAAVGTTGGSGVSVADYLGNGTKTLIITDANATGNKDTKLYSWSTSTGELVLTEVAALPASRFYLSKWDAARTAAGVAPHEIRNISVDFNRDGRPDVVVISTLPDKIGSGSHGYSEVQFLRNDGGGVFTDVTDTVLVGYNTSTYASYNPVLVDVNKDGLLDILLSAVDQTGSYDSSRVLLATSDGKFKEVYASVFKDFYNQTQNMTGAAQSQLQTINIAQGPNGDLYLITAVNFDNNGTTNTAVYAARINSNGTTSAQATIDAVSTLWPYLTGVQANAVLAQTASLNLNGIPVVDWWAALSPVGGLGISLDGRTGQRRPITGSISVPGLDAAALKNLSAVDGLGRHFQVNLSSMAATPGYMPVQYSVVGADLTTNWTSRLVDQENRDTPGMSLSGVDSERFASSITSRYLSWQHDMHLRIGAARMPGSPWLRFNGIFGTVESSTMLEFTGTKFWPEGYFSQAGAIQTSTQFTPGLVTDISPIWAGYAMAGWANRDWSLYGGVQPTIFAGHMTLRLPTSVDNQGTMHYTQRKFDIRNDPVTFVGMEKRWRWGQHGLEAAAVTNSQALHAVNIKYRLDF